jgi:outer membrane protein insertion porin family
MRQFEGAWSSNNSIEAGKVRLERLGYFKEVEVETYLFLIQTIRLI